jgi:hypothetical protein
MRRLPGHPWHGTGPYPHHDQGRDSGEPGSAADLGLETKAAANRRVIAAMRQRLAAGEQVARMYQEPGLAWLERQAEVAEDLVAERQAALAGRTADLGQRLQAWPSSQ